MKNNENYYLLNNDWFKSYLNINNLTNVYTYLITNNIIKKINNYNNLKKKKKIFMIFNYINKKELIDMKKNKNNNESLKEHKLFQLKYNRINNNSNKIINYMYDFLLLKEETYKLFTKNLNIDYKTNQYFCFFDIKKIFIVIKKQNQFTIELGHINDQNNFIIEILFDYNSIKDLEDNIIRIIDKGYSLYYKSSLMFSHNDYVSPIFNQNQNIIGYAYKYNPNSLINYEDYIINEHLKKYIELYLYYVQLKISLKQNKIEFKYYYLVNEESLKKFKNKYEYKYDFIEKQLNNSSPSNQIVNSIKSNKNYKDTNIDEKKLTLIIKSIPIDINIKFNLQDNNNDRNSFVNNEQIEPLINTYNYEYNKTLFYYNNFEIISESMYNKIFKKDENNHQKNYYTKCLFFEKIIMVELSPYVSNINKYVLEVGIIEKDYIFIPCYTLIYNNYSVFNEHINYINQTMGIVKFFKELSFKEGNSNTLHLFKNNSLIEIGKIYNLKINFKNQKQNNKINSIQNNNYNPNNFVNNNQQPNYKVNNNQNFNQFQLLQNNNKQIGFNNNQLPLPMNNNINNNQIGFNNNVLPLPLNNNINNKQKGFNNNVLSLPLNNNINNNQMQFFINNNLNNIPMTFQNVNNQLALFQNNNQNINQINNNHNNNQKISSSIKNDFPKPQKIGLQNVGATCYMNATLQCFCQIEDLVNYFKYKPYINEVISKYKKKGELCLTTSFKYLVENLWPSVYDYINNKYNHKNSNNKYFAPYKFKETISKMNPLFAGAQANDSKDLVNFIVMTLHEELNKAKKNPIDNNNNFQFIDQTNKQIIFNNYLKNFKNENKSIISDIFYGINFTTTQCSNCKIIKYNYQAYFFIIFPLEEVRKFKIELLTNQFMQMNQNLFIMNPMLFQQYLFTFQLNCQNINKVDINDCFLYNQKIDLFKGENSMYCNNCKKTCPSSYCTQIFIAPKILIIVLNRGKGIEFKVKLDFTEYLNLENFIEIKKSGFNYRLIGVVTHMGESGASGHFIAYCRSPIDNQWYKYNDDIVTIVKNFKGEIIDYAMPYILFYEKN